jgi:hypothetical protein
MEPKEILELINKYQEKIKERRTSLKKEKRGWIKIVLQNLIIENEEIIKDLEKIIISIENES